MRSLASYSRALRQEAIRGFGNEANRYLMAYLPRWSLAPRLARLHLLDMACGSAKITMTLCRKAFAAHQKSFDLTLVDVVRGNKSIANAFYRNPRVFGNVVFRRESLFDWVDKNAGKPQMRFDVALLLRACNLFSRFSIEKMSYREANALIGQDTTCDPLDSQVLRPAELIENNSLGRIQHGIGRFIFKNGWVFRQFSASDYFKAIHVVMGGRLSAGEDIRLRAASRIRR